MNDFEKEEIIKAREYQVVKSNDLVLKSRYSYNLTEQKAIAYVCSMVRPTKLNPSGFVLEYKFNILDFARICGLESTGGRLYENIKDTLESLSNKSMWITLEDNSESLVRWLNKVNISKQSGIVNIRLDDDLVPYLFNLRCRFLSYGLKNILCMKSQYSIRLYEILKAYHDFKTGQTDYREYGDKIKSPRLISWNVDIDELKQTLMVDNIASYNHFGLFKKKVLEIAVKEINELTDINVTFETVTKGRKVIKLIFSIINKELLKRIKSESTVIEKLGLPE